MSKKIFFTLLLVKTIWNEREIRLLEIIGCEAEENGRNNYNINLWRIKFEKLWITNLDYANILAATLFKV